MDKDYLAYRKVAEPIEDEYWAYQARTKDIAARIELLNARLATAAGAYERVCYLGFLCQEIALLEAAERTTGLAGEKYDELFRSAYFDPHSLIGCAAFYLGDLGDARKAKDMAIYAAFVAEHTQAFVWHAHQTVIRAAYRLRDLPTVERSVRRILEYRHEPESPDSGIDADVVGMVGELDIDPAMKAEFLAAGSM